MADAYLKARKFGAKNGKEAAVGRLGERGDAAVQCSLLDLEPANGRAWTVFDGAWLEPGTVSASQIAYMRTPLTEPHQLDLTEGR